MNFFEEFKDYRDILKAELDKRALANPQYSLRAFARDLELSPSNLSELLNEKVGLSSKKAMFICEKLGLTEAESKHFCGLVNGLKTKVLPKKDLSASERVDRKIIGLEFFKFISEWHHFAILELIDTKDFKSDLPWIAKRLGIRQHLVRSALKRLRELGLISIKGRAIIKSQKILETPNDIPSQAIREFHSSILKMAAQKIFSLSVDEREFATTLLPFELKEIDEAKKMIRDFKERFNARFGRNKKGDAVYAFAIQFFETTQKPRDS